MSEDILDVAIVGGGVSGVYAAWRLRTDPPKGKPQPNVQVFEQSQRIGGRLLSVAAARISRASSASSAGCATSRPRPSCDR